MSYLKLKRAVWAAVAAGAFAATAAPTDNLRTEYRNDVHPHDDGAYGVKPAVQLGAGSGYFFTTNRAIRTRIGSFKLDTQLALDDKIKAAATISGKIAGGNVQISSANGRITIDKCFLRPRLHRGLQCAFCLKSCIRSNLCLPKLCLPRNPF